MARRRGLVPRHALALAALLWSACPIRTLAQTSTPPAVLHDLAALSDLQSAFDRDIDTTRIVLLLSPT
jgi:hypothetical protein